MSDTLSNRSGFTNTTCICAVVWMFTTLLLPGVRRVDAPEEADDVSSASSSRSKLGARLGAGAEEEREARVGLTSSSNSSKSSSSSV